MALVHIKSSELSKDQKFRIGERIISAFSAEGVPTGAVVLLFEPEVMDIYMDGGFVSEAKAVAAPPAQVPQPPFQAAPMAAPVQMPSQPLAQETYAPMVKQVYVDSAPDFRTKSRRNKAELSDLKAKLVRTLQAKGALSSFQAQIELGLKACDWAPATLRRFFSELEEDGVILKQGQKRGTRYVWKGITTQQPTGGAATRLIKRQDDETGE